MKKKVLFIALITIIIPSKSQQPGKNFIDQNYIEVRGRAEMEIIPDLIYLTIIIDEKDNKAKQPLEDLER